MSMKPQGETEEGLDGTSYLHSLLPLVLGLTPLCGGEKFESVCRGRCGQSHPGLPGWW